MKLRLLHWITTILWCFYCKFVYFGQTLLQKRGYKVPRLGPSWVHSNFFKFKMFSHLFISPYIWTSVYGLPVIYVQSKFGVYKGNLLKTNVLWLWSHLSVPGGVALCNLYFRITTINKHTCNKKEFHWTSIPWQPAWYFVYMTSQSLFQK